MTPAEEFSAEQIEELRDMIADFPAKMRLRGQVFGVCINMPASGAEDDMRGNVIGTSTTVFAVTQDLAAVGSVAIGGTVELQPFGQTVFAPYSVVAKADDVVRTVLTVERCGTVRGGGIYG